MTDQSPDLSPAVLGQLAELARKLGSLEEGSRASARNTADALRSAADRLEALEGSQQDISAVLGGLQDQVQELAALMGAEDAPKPGYAPIPSPRWFELTGPERAAAVARLDSWVKRVYGPGYGHLAARLPVCWARHDFCLYTLDWLSELWSVLYLQPDRSPNVLVGQAELMTRLMTAASKDMAAEATGCPHEVPALNGAALVVPS